jgi:DNA-binding response OmpR family regulator
MSTVMVVDDEQRILRFLSRALSAEGHTVRTASSGRAALDLLRDQPVDLVLLDLVMPQGNGLQVLAALRKQENTTPVIVLSGVADVAARVQALDRGAIDFVAKPFHTAELVARIRRHTLPVPHEPPADRRYLSADGVRLDLDRRRVRVDGHPVEVVLSEREFALLAYLVRRRGEDCRNPPRPSSPRSCCPCSSCRGHCVLNGITRCPPFVVPSRWAPGGPWPPWRASSCWVTTSTATRGRPCAAPITPPGAGYGASTWWSSPPLPCPPARGRVTASLRVESAVGAGALRPARSSHGATRFEWRGVTLPRDPSSSRR